MAAEAVANGVFVDLWWWNGAFRVVDVVYPLMVNLWVSELVDAIDVFGCFLVDLFLEKEPGSCVVGELAEEVLSFVCGAG